MKLIIAYILLTLIIGFVLCAGLYFEPGMTIPILVILGFGFGISWCIYTIIMQGVPSK
jgi:hypothetical protein